MKRRILIGFLIVILSLSFIGCNNDQLLIKGNSNNKKIHTSNNIAKNNNQIDKKEDQKGK